MYMCCVFICVCLCICVYVLSHFTCVQLFAASWTVAHQAPLSIGFSRQEYWSGLACPSPADLPDPGIEPVSLRSPSLVGGFFITSATWEALGTLLGYYLFYLKSNQVKLDCLQPRNSFMFSWDYIHSWKIFLCVLWR